MKIAVFSDVHDNLVNLDKFLKWSNNNNIKELLCCGDVTTVQTLEIVSKKFSGNIHLVIGNVDMFTEKEIANLSNVKCYGKVGRALIGGRQIGMCHEPFLIEKVLEIGKCDVVFFGHTHKPWIEEKQGVSTVNPGTLGGVFQKATFSVFETTKGKLDLKILNTL